MARLTANLTTDIIKNNLNNSLTSMCRQQNGDYAVRRILGVLLAIILLYSAASAEGLNFSSLTPTELQEFINTARNELLRRSAINDGKLFLVDETDGVQIYLTGRGEMNWRNEYELEIVVINNSSTAVTISFDEIIVNGSETETALVSVRDIGAGKKKKDATKAGFANMAMYE